MRAWPALLVDAALVLVFVLIGRRTHDDPLSLAGLASLVTGVTVWVATVAVGMLLRAAASGERREQLVLGGEVVHPVAVVLR